jgi:di/tricarboxylate transporter
LDLATVSILGLIIAIVLSCTTSINVGILAMALAWIIGVYLAGMPVNDVVAGFPTVLFLTLAGVTLLFTLAKVNGTLDKIAHRSVLLCRGNVGMVPIMFFFLAFVLASIGPGSTASAALTAPTAMTVAGRLGIPAFLMAIMVGNGSSAASLIPIAPTGIIVNDLMVKMGLSGYQWQNFVTVFIAHTSVGFLGYFLLGGWRYFTKSAAAQAPPLPDLAVMPNGGVSEADRFNGGNYLTIAVIVALICVVVFLNANVGLAAMAGSVVLILTRTADESAALKAMPWGPILMVCGVTVLVSLLEKTGGMELFSTMLARFSSQETITAFTASLTGVISIYSSTSGVVLPAFLPTVPGIVTKLGGGSSIAIAYSMIVGAHLVDVSPLSTTGALCIAAAPPGTDIPKMFRWMLAWGLAMVPIAAIGCYLVFGLLWSR